MGNSLQKAVAEAQGRDVLVFASSTPRTNAKNYSPRSIRRPIDRINEFSKAQQTLWLNKRGQNSGHKHSETFGGPRYKPPGEPHSFEVKTLFHLG